MLYFFRRIRKSLLGSGQAKKYLLYAIGEIFLVVLGILIALQINNRNEWIKTRNFELKMLTEVRNSLSRDTAYFNMLTSRLTRIDTSAKRLINLLMEDVKNDSLYLHHMIETAIPYTFIYEDGAYEALKASGIENIANDSLRNSLINHYGFRMPRNIKLMKINRTDSDLKLAEDLEWELLNFQADTSYGKPSIARHGFKPGAIGGDSFNRYIRIKQRDAENGLSWLAMINKESKEVLTQLNIELNKTE